MDELSYVREFEHVTLARLLLAQGTRDRADDSIGAAIDLLDRLLAAAEERAAGRQRRSTSWSCRRSPSRGAATCRRSGVAGAGAGPGRAGGLRPDLRRRGAAHGGPAEAGRRSREVASSYVRRLLASSRDGRRGEPTTDQPLIEPLSERELEVLRLLGSDSRPGDRPRAQRVPEHGADPHQEHLRQARREQPPGGRTAELTELDLLARAARPSTRSPSQTPFTTCGDARSPHPLPPLVPSALPAGGRGRPRKGAA